MLTAGPPFIKAVKTAMMKDVHLMVREPLASLGDYAAAGADIITIHPDACVHPHRVLQVLGIDGAPATAPDRTVARGIALNPGTPVDVLDPFLDDLEMVTLRGASIPDGEGRPSSPRTLGRIDAVRTEDRRGGARHPDRRGRRHHAPQHRPARRARRGRSWSPAARCSTATSGRTSTT
ncbi:MAG: hypothetical protein MZU84_04765 [Sphingobacterium sp.]|nr:hypothetical protein [Sphingobacterium sp.]